MEICFKKVSPMLPVIFFFGNSGTSFPWSKLSIVKWRFLKSLYLRLTDQIPDLLFLISMTYSYWTNIKGIWHSTQTWVNLNLTVWLSTVWVPTMVTYQRSASSVDLAGSHLALPSNSVILTFMDSIFRIWNLDVYERFCKTPILIRALW